VTGLPPLPFAPHHGFLFTGCYLPFQDCADNPVNWYAMGELMPLRRDSGRWFEFASRGAAPAPIILRSGDRDFEDDFDAGARVVVGRALGDWYRLEAVWIGSYQWDDTAAVRDPAGNIYTPFSNFGRGPTAGVDPAEFASISFSSQLHNVELNLRRAIAVPPSYVEASFLVGARYMRLEEDFRLVTSNSMPGPATIVNDVAVAADNDLLGVQIGLLTQFRVHPRGWVDFDAKAALFANDASQQTVYQNTNNNGIETTSLGAADDETTAYLGDLSLTFNYQCSRALTFRVGYNAWFLAGVALGPDNFERDINLLRLGPRSVDHRGRIVYHGPSIGLVGAW
jgi:hypothetical protein